MYVLEHLKEQPQHWSAVPCAGEAVHLCRHGVVWCGVAVFYALNGGCIYFTDQFILWLQYAVWAGWPS
jgi:hypothetical protein